MSTIKPISIPSKRLSATITGSDSSFKLDNILGWNGSDLTSADFGTKAYGCFRNSAGTLIEFFDFDPSTIASSPITINYRGLNPNGDNLTTEVSANKLTWIKGDTIVELGSHLPQLLVQAVTIIDDQTIAGVKTFSSMPKSSDIPTDNDHLINKLYADALVIGALTTINVVVPATAGETIAAGDLVYYDTTDKEWKLCDADTAATVENVMLAIAQGSGTNGVAITGGVLMKGVDSNQTGMTAGDIMYASNTAGEIANSAGTNDVAVGIAKSATDLYFNPRFNQQLTEDQIDALVGTSGTPSSSNKYVTDDDTTGTGDVVRSSITNPLVDKFGGDGSDGALTVTSGVTDIDLGGAKYFIKNYTSIEISGTGSLTFSNPHSTGTVIVLRSQGDVILTSSTTPMIDASALGGDGGASVTGSANAVGLTGINGVVAELTTDKGDASATVSTASIGGTATASYTFNPFSRETNIDINLLRYWRDLFVGAGASSGCIQTNSGSHTSGKGGKGGGNLIIECGGAWNFTTANGISVAGENGGDGVCTDREAGGGGGGGGGLFIALYNTLTANSGTVNISGGTKGTGCGTFYGNTSGGAGGASLINNGSNGTTANPHNGGDGGDGKSIVIKNTSIK